MHNLKIPPHILDVLTQPLHTADGQLFRTFDVVHAVVMIARIDDVPVSHHLPPTCGTADALSDNPVGVISTGWIQYQFHVPDIVFPDHGLKIVVFQVLVGSGGRLIPHLPVGAPAQNLPPVLCLLLQTTGDGMTAETAQPVRRKQLRQPANVASAGRHIADQSGTGPQASVPIRVSGVTSTPSFHTV